MNYEPKFGDIFLSDSNRLGAKIIKFLQEAPTLWHWIYRQIRGTQQTCRYYHAGMVFDYEQIIEQQGKVQVVPLKKILSRSIVIYRYKILNDFERRLIRTRATEDIGKGFDIPLIIGKTLTWLTGIRWFATIIGKLSKNEEICISRVAKWYRGICTFGVKDYNLVTTKILDEYCLNNSSKWEVVYQNGG